MAADKACTKCRAMVDGSACLVCGNSDLTKSWEGQIFIFAPDNSEVAKAIDAKVPGRYALKIK
jgi:DNA-directed RNA polymerase subunit E"